MTLLITWVVFPLVLALLATGCGLLVDTLIGRRLPGAVLPAVGLALIIVVDQFLTLDDTLAKAITPVTVAMAVAGWGIAWPWNERIRLDWSAAAAVLAVFAVFAAPIVLSGKATFAGFIKLDDTATWMALTDRVMEHGRSLSGLVPSSYEATLHFNLAEGYPVGVFLPLGVGRELVNQDVAWVIQPYMAFLGALLALALWSITAMVLESRVVRALVAFVAAQSALLYGYYLWGGIKEVAGAALLASIAALVAWAIREAFARRVIAPLAIASSALIGVLSGGGGIWLLPMLVAGFVFAIRMLGGREASERALAFLILAAVLTIPVIVTGSLKPPTSSSLTDSTAIGNLFHPLNRLQIFGVWPNGDFRADPSDMGVTYVLIAVMGGAAIWGLYAAWRARGLSVLLYVGGVLVSGLAIALIGSPWVGGKALATASPAIPLAAALGAGVLYAGGRRTEAVVLGLAIAAGVIWSNALQYRDVNLAPRDQLAELETIAPKIAGEGPTLMTEYLPYGVRHFLRDADPEGASELRTRQDFLVNGHVLHKGLSADTDRFPMSTLLQYRTLVLRRSPAQSRPPSPYQLIWRGHYYEVWQRPPGIGSNVIQHLPLGTSATPVGVPSCSAVEQLASTPGVTQLLAASRRPVVAVPLRQATTHPGAWNSAFYRTALLPTTPGAFTARVRVPTSGEYEIWLGGSVRPEVDTFVDGREVGSVRAQLQNYGEYVSLGTAHLDPGVHVVRVQFHGSDLHPGSGGAPDPIGPLTLSSEDTADTSVLSFRPDQARELCGKRWDWIEGTSG